MRKVLTEIEKEQRRKDKEIVETDVEIISLVDLSVGKCGNQGGLQTMDYNPCRFVVKDKKYIADIQRNGMARVKFGKNNLGLNLEKGNYKRVTNVLKNKKFILYGLIVIAGYLAYKKFKK